MYKVSVSIPAVSTNIGPGYDVLGLALNLRNVVEMSLPRDDQLTVIVRGEGQDRLPTDFHNPAVRAAIRLFQAVEQAPAGLSVRCTNAIPLDVGLSARATLCVGGLVAANNLLGNPLPQAELIALAAQITERPEAVVTATRGSLGLCSHSAEGELLHRTLEVAPLRVILAVPELADHAPKLRDALPDPVPLADAIFNMGHTALLIEALRAGDLALLARAVADRLHEPHRTPHISGYAAARAAALEAGAAAVTLCGAGPALLAFAEGHHQIVESAILSAFHQAGVRARTWILGVDRQGVVISVVE